MHCAALSCTLSTLKYSVLTTIKTQVETVNRDIAKAKSETESYAKAAKADTLKKIDEFDRKVEEGASKSKSYLSSWFGSK
jgi:vacuolar-type H+-ATPase subunit H